MKDEVGYVDDLEKRFKQWSRIGNPLAILKQALIARGCTKATLTTYTHCGVRYMRYHNYDPTFGKDELMAYLASLAEEGLSPRTQTMHRICLKCWWDAMGLLWPLLGRRVHTQQRRQRSEVVMFTRRQVAEMIKLVRMKGTPEDKYLLCLATIYAPRRTELGNITGHNFEWNGDGGTLTFLPMKHGVERVHMVPAALVPYVKPYSAEAKPIPQPVMTRKFRRMCARIGYRLPSAYNRGPKDRRNNLSWHAFRHAVTTALFEAGLDHTRIQMWMGWSGSAADMPRHYYHPDDLDAKVMAKHPFLKLWA